MASRANRTDTDAAQEGGVRPDDDEQRDRRAPDDPTDVGKHGWMATVKRTVKEFKDDNVTDWAAALTYYGLLSLFPALAALISIVGLVMEPKTVTDALTKLVGTASPDAVKVLRGPIEQITANRSRAGIALVISIGAALWSASGYIGAFMRASNAIFESPEGRPFWKLRPLQVLVTLGMTMLFALVLIALVVTGPLAGAIGNEIGLGSTAVTIWSIAKWPVLAFVVSLMLAVLYYAAPNARLPRFQWLSPGAVVALVGWVVVSFGFFQYAKHFGSYDKTYGALGAAITLLVWMWLTNVAILFGQELNAEIERGRELAAGEPALEHIQLPLRSTPKHDRDQQAAQNSRAVVEGSGNGGATRDEAVDHLSSSPRPERRADRPR